MVPSIGSMIHCRWLWPLEPCSSPSTASRERTRAQRAPDRLLDRLVGVGHRRQVGLAHHVQVQRLEPALGDRVGVVGEHVGQAEVVGVVDGARAGPGDRHGRQRRPPMIRDRRSPNPSARPFVGCSVIISAGPALISSLTWSVAGLPLHPLVVHAAVVFAPLAALTAIAYVVAAEVPRPPAVADPRGRADRVRVRSGRRTSRATTSSATARFDPLLRRAPRPDPQAPELRADAALDHDRLRDRDGRGDLPARRSRHPAHGARRARRDRGRAHAGVDRRSPATRAPGPSGASQSG